MSLSGKQKNYLRGLAHSKNPVVTIGTKGLTDTVMQEVDLALNQHELIKIKLTSNSKTEKVALLAQITGQSDSEPVQLIGRVAILYRANIEPSIMLPSI